MKKVFILAFLSFMGQTSWAQIREFQTTRLNSTAGTGVASILSTEAAILNPAASAFFDGSSFSYQRYSASLRKENPARVAANDEFPKKNSSEGAFLSDHSGPIKGGIGYIKQNENNYERERMILHGSAPMGANASIGVSYNYLKDKLPSTFSRRHEIHHQMTVGTTYIVDPSTILGLIVVDPTQTISGNERVIAGFQYSIAEKVMLLGDVGTQYTKDVTDKYLWRAAFQLNVFADFFLRAGKFHDNVSKTKGTGWGAGWIGPRLGIEFAQKISDQYGDTSYIYKGESLVDTSLSMIIKF